MSDMTFRKTFTTDPSGDFTAHVGKVEGGMLLRLGLVRSDGVTAEVASPHVKLSSSSRGLQVVAYEDDVAPGDDSITNIWNGIGPGDLTLEVTGGDNDTEYVLGVLIADSDMKRHSIKMVVDAEGSATGRFSVEQGVVMQAGVTCDSIPPDTSTVTVSMVVNHTFPVKGETTPLDGSTLGVNDPADTGIWEVTPRGEATVTLSGELEPDTVLYLHIDMDKE